MSMSKKLAVFKKVAISSTSGRRYSFAGQNLTKIQWYMLAAILGGLLLSPFGGIGIVAFGGAIGISWWVVGAIAGWLIARDRMRGK